MTQTKDSRPGIADLIRHTYQTASVAGPAQQEAIELLQSFGFDPRSHLDVLTDDYIFAVLDRAAAAHVH